MKLRMLLNVDSNKLLAPMKRRKRHKDCIVKAVLLIGKRKNSNRRNSKHGGWKGQVKRKKVQKTCKHMKS